MRDRSFKKDLPKVNALALRHQLTKISPELDTIFATSSGQVLGAAAFLAWSSDRSPLLFLDGVYVERPDGLARFRWVKAPSSAELTQLADRIARRVGRFLERQGLLERWNAGKDAKHAPARWRSVVL